MGSASNERGSVEPDETKIEADKKSLSFFHSTPYSPNPSYKKTGIEIPLGAEPYITQGFIRAALTSNAVDLPTLYRARKAIARSIAFYGNRLKDIDYETFNFLNPTQRQALEEELPNTAPLLYDECQLHLFEKELPLLRKRGQQLERTAKLLYRLRNTPELGQNEQPNPQLQAQIDTSLDKPVKYIALTNIAPLIAETMLCISASEGLEAIRDKMTDANMYRLNWVWGGGLDRALLGVIPAGSGHIQHTQNTLNAIQPLTGYMSFVLYYFRLGIRLYLLTKGTFKGSWMDPWQTDAEKAMDKVSIGERFKTQCETHGFGIINDFFWATANMACFFWLIKDGVLGSTAYMGNALTGVLLLMDLFLIHCQFINKNAEHHAVLKQYEEEIAQLNSKLSPVMDSTAINVPLSDTGRSVEPGKTMTDDEKAVLNEHLAALEDARDSCVMEWKYANRDFYSSLVYAAGVLAGFSLVCCFFFPPTGIPLATALLLGVLGSALSFVLTLAYHSMITNSKIEQLTELMQATTKKKEGIENTLADKTLAPNQHKLLILNLEHLKEKLQYQKDMINHHRKERVQQIFSEAMLPATAFVFLVFLPLNLGLPLMLPIIALLLLSSTILARYKPPEPKVSNVNGRLTSDEADLNSGLEPSKKG